MIVGTLPRDTASLEGARCRRAALRGALLGCVAIVAWGSGCVPTVGGTRATDDLGSQGTAAFASVLRELGYGVEPLRLGLHVLSRRPAGVLVLAPAPGLVSWPALTARDATAITSFARRGGTVLAVAEHGGAFADALGLTVRPRARPAPTGQQRALATHPSSVTAGGPLALLGTSAFAPGVGTPLFVAQGEIVVASLPLGAGRIVLLADAAPISNSGIALGGNLAFLLAVVGDAIPAGGDVLFDDLHAGAGDDHGAVAYARRAGAGPALLLFAAALLLLLQRLTAPTALGPVGGAPLPVAGAAEFVRGLGGLYRRAGLARHALAVVSRQFRRAMEARSGVPWERERLDAFVRTELGAAAEAQFSDVRDRFAALFADAAPTVPAVLEVASRAARFEREWLQTARSRSAPVSDPPLSPQESR